MNELMTSSRPYLLKALNSWINDNGMTPHIAVDVMQKDVIVPQEFVSSGKIILNLSTSAVHGLTIDNDFMCFSARFSGRAMDVIVPVQAIMAIYAKENGQGMVFTPEETLDAVEKPAGEESVSDKEVERPTLRLVR